MVVNGGDEDSSCCCCAQSRVLSFSSQNDSYSGLFKIAREAHACN